MARLGLIAAAAVLVAASPPASTAGWIVGKIKGSPAALVRTGEGVTLDYHFVPNDYDALQITVDPCGQGPWWMKDGMAPNGDTLAERRDYVRKAIDELFHNARLNCTLPQGIETRMMDGFDDAWAQYEAMKK